MIESLIMLVFYLIIVGVIWWGVNQILAVIPLPEPIGQVIRVVMIVILVLVVVLVLLKLIGVVVPLRLPG